MIDESEKVYTIRTVDSGGSSTTKNPEVGFKFYVLQSRRFVEYEFSQGEQSRDDYLRNSNKLYPRRTPQLESFYLRLFAMQKNKTKFNNIVFCKWKFPTIAKIFPQAPVGNFYVNPNNFYA
ncbi:MAG TPA: hypothetical protein GX505_11010 [Clostridiales bacterium]|nr:hypothetical protein [Clostridiales bacterium]